MTELGIGFLSIRQLMKAYRLRELSPVEVTRQLLETAGKLNNEINAFITFNEEEALKQAENAELRFLAGKELRYLEGIPITIKDNINIKNLPTTAGSRVLKDFVPSGDATVITRLRDEGAVLLGKLNMHEFASGSTGVNPFYGNVGNPWDPKRVPGGSSSGCGAAVGAGLCTVSIGTDTAGSIRIPSALSGVVGLKPTYGLVSRYGVIPLSWTQDCVGPICHTVEDAAYMLNIINGYDPKDPSSRCAASVDYTQGLADGVQGLRIGIPKEFFFEGLETDVEMAVQTALSHLQSLGAVLEEISIQGVETALMAGFLSVLTEFTAYSQQYLPERANDYSQDIRVRLEAARAISAIDYINAQRVKRIFAERVLREFERFQLLVTPTTVITAPRQDQFSIPFLGNAMHPTPLLARLTRPFSVAGFPALSVPCGFSSEDLPIGLQLVAGPCNERTLLKAAYAYQTTTLWSNRRPQLIM
jgi:aspartyl-tRNA(Asn)/glutamyl-tRNA(Gln) amidotransferase subunit A